MRNHLAVAAALASGVAPAVGCGDGIYVPSDGAVFALESIDGASLPAVRTVAPGLTYTLFADTIRIAADDGFVRTIDYEFADDGSGVADTLHDRIDGVAVWTAGVLVFETPCDDVVIRTAQCAPPDTARVRDGDLIVRSLLPPAGLKRFSRR